MTQHVPDSAPTLTPSWSVNDIVRWHPMALTVLNTFGIDTCCGGGDSLASVARDARVDPDAVVQALVAVCTPSPQDGGTDIPPGSAEPTTVRRHYACYCSMDAQ